MAKIEKVEEIDIEGENLSIHQEVWVADFGLPNLEDELKNEVLKLKPKTFKNFSWVFSAVLLALIIIIGEYAWWLTGLNHFWAILTITIVTWIFRLLVLLLWLYLAHYRWYLKRDKILATAFSSVILASIVIAILKITLVKEAWAWLNILVEPIWALIVISVVCAIFFKFNKK